MPDIDYLRTIHIDALSRAARSAGLSWKSGTMSKADIIESLARYPAMLAAAVAMLRRQNAPTGRVTWKPAGSVKVNPSDWLDEVDEAASESSPEASEARGPVVPTPSPVALDLSPYALRSEVQSQGEAFGIALAAQRSTLTAHVEWARRENTALRAEVDALTQRRPLQVNIPGRSPQILEESTHAQFPDLLQWLETIGRVILTGPAGTGKSRAAAQCAKALGLPFYLQTPFTQSYEYLGHRDAQGAFHETPTFRAYTQGGVLLMDEADSSSPDAFLAANPILDGNGFAMFGDGHLHAQHHDFRVILNMNTTGDGASLAYSGRNPLDGATIARFGGMLHWGIDPHLEKTMAAGLDAWHSAIKAIRTLMERRSILTVNATPRHVLIGAKLLQNPHFSNRRSFILEASLKNGPLADIWHDVESLPEVRRFLAGA